MDFKKHRMFLQPEDFAAALEGMKEDDMPSGLWVEGDWQAVLRAVRVAVVGSRTPTVYGRRMARGIAAYLARRGAVVVSGLAYGIDRIAHEAALEAGGLTAAVLGTGLERVYPSSHRRLQQELIPASGVVMSQWPLNAEPEPFRFPARNRIIAAFCRAVVVVEGGLHSGSLITARWAAEYGKEVYALPGCVDSPMSQGPNRLIQDGAAPILTPEDLDIILGGSCAPQASHLSLRGMKLNEQHRRVLAAIGKKPVKIEEIQMTTQINLETVSRAVLELEMAGQIEEVAPYGYIRSFHD